MRLVKVYFSKESIGFGRKVAERALAVRLEQILKKKTDFEYQSSLAGHS